MGEGSPRLLRAVTFSSVRRRGAGRGAAAPFSAPLQPRRCRAARAGVQPGPPGGWMRAQTPPPAGERFPLLEPPSQADAFHHPRISRHPFCSEDFGILAWPSHAFQRWWWGEIWGRPSPRTLLRAPRPPPSDLRYSNPCWCWSPRPGRRLMHGGVRVCVGPGGWGLWGSGLLGCPATCTKPVAQLAGPLSRAPLRSRM